MGRQGRGRPVHEQGRSLRRGRGRIAGHGEVIVNTAGGPRVFRARRVDHYDRRNTARQARTHIQRLESPGLKVTLTPLPDLTRCPEVA